MASLYLNRLSHEARKELEQQLHMAQDGKCFICAEPIDLELHKESIDIDHIEPLKTGGKDGPENFALTHESCNRSKQASDLRVARVLARFDRIHASAIEKGRSANLGDVLREYGGARFELPIRREGERVAFSLPDAGQNDVVTARVFEDDLSGFECFFAELPITYLHHDDHINPRAIGKNLRKLVEEFHKRLPQLHITLGWVETEGNHRSKVKVFDGQHKAASQILLGVKKLPVRVFLDPDLDVLLTANTHAGTTLRQVAFDKSIQRSLGSALLQDRIDRYRCDLGYSDDYEGFSERDLVNHFKGESKEMKRYVIDWVRNSITTRRDNKLRDFIDYGGRGYEMPLSYSTMEKTFYSFFIHGDLLSTPFNYLAEEGENPRVLEIEQIVRLMNVIAEVIFVGKYDHSLGTRRIEHNIQQGKDIPEPHLRAYRMAKEEILYNWLRYTGHIVKMCFITMGKPIDESKLFQYPIPESTWDNIRCFMDNLAKLPIWVNRDLSSSVFGGKQVYDFWQKIFETGKTPDGQEVMPQGINIMDMIVKTT